MKTIIVLMFSLQVLFATTGPDTVVLTSGDTESDSVEQGVMNYYKISAQSGKNVEVIMNQLTADADIYVKLGSYPKKDVHDCSSLKGSLNSERCAMAIPEDTDVFIGVYGYRAADYAITATVTGLSVPEVLTFDTPVESSVEEAEWKYYKISAANAQVVTSEISNLVADADIYVKVGSQPDKNTFDCKSTKGSTTTDSCSITMNGNNDVFIGVHGYQATDYSVKVTGTKNIVTLVSGVGVSSNIQQGKNDFYKIAGLEGQKIEIILDNLTADADLSVREGSKPTDDTFKCKSSNGSTTTDTCTITLAQSGDLYIRIYGYRTSAYQIKATISADDIQTLTSGVSVSGTVAQNEMKYYKIATSSTKTVKGLIDLLTDDADIYIKKGAKPTLQSYDCRSTNGQTTNDSCSLVVNNQDVFIGVLGFRTTDYRLTATATSVALPGDPIILEDAEGGTLNPNWIHVLGNVAPYIVATPDIAGAPEGEGVMVQLADSDPVSKNRYILPVNNTTHKILSMDCGGLPDHQLVEHHTPGFIKHYAVGVRVETKFGTRFMQWYSFYNHNNVAAFKEASGANTFLNYPSPVETTSGYFQATNIWNHFEVNIEEELQILEPGNELYKIVNFSTTGGFLDNITLSTVQD